MMESVTPAPSVPASAGLFLTTRWSVVLRAGKPDEADAEKALSQLCRDYWRPLYHFARRSGFSQEDAEDLTQGFIAGLLETRSIGRADPARGRFRSFLLGSFGHYIANHRRGEQAQKRGGGTALIQINAAEAEAALAMSAVDTLTPERLYERSWALALMEKVMERLRSEFAAAGRDALFAALHPFLSGAAGRPGYAKIGAALGLSESAVTVTVHRMRKRYGALLREEIAATVADETEVDDELRYLMQVVSGG
jgi:RNA polymerase sigma factor (sigma-70 family)